MQKKTRPAVNIPGVLYCTAQQLGAPNKKNSRPLLRGLMSFLKKDDVESDDMRRQDRKFR